MNVLADSFPGTDSGGIWGANSWGGATVAETGGELVVTLPSGSAMGTGGFFTTNRYYDLRGDSISIEVTNAANTATSAEAYFKISDGIGNHIEIDQQYGWITFGKNIGGVWTTLKSTAYSPKNDLYWRIREDGTNTYAETSSDGTTWLVQSQVATTSLFPLSSVQIAIGGTTNGGEVNPGSVHFAKVNGGGTPTGKWCPVRSITDDFNSGTRSDAWKRSWTGSPMTVAQQGGQLVFPLVPNYAVYSSYVSSAAYDLTGSAVLVQVPTTANTAASAETYLYLDGPGGNGIQMLEANGKLVSRLRLAGAINLLGSTVYDSAQHAWWRIRESGGTLFWDTAPDGKEWTVLQQLSPLPFAIDVFDVELGSGTFASEANPGTSRFDNLNLPPP